MHKSNCNPDCANFAHSSMSENLLREISPSDERWDTIREQADRFKNLYRGTVFDCYADRIDSCSGWLKFTIAVNSETGESKLKLQDTRFCRVPRCPVCQWRKTMVWRAKAFKVIPKIIEAYPSARFLFLTLTVRNCPLVELRSTLALMNTAWKRLSQRSNFPAIGWIKAVEVTRVWDCYDGDRLVGRHGSTWVEDWQVENNKKLRLVATDECHPHFHCLLMVNSSYFSGKYYLTHEKWLELWKQSLRVEYDPNVRIQAVKSLKRADGGMLEAVLETLKYSIKATDVLSGNSPEQIDNDQEWLVELTNQLYKTRSVATGGVLKDYLKELEQDPSPEDLIHTDSNLNDDLINKTVALCFNWNYWMRRYIFTSTR